MRSKPTIEELPRKDLTTVHWKTRPSFVSSSYCLFLILKRDSESQLRCENFLSILLLFLCSTVRTSASILMHSFIQTSWQLISCRVLVYQQYWLVNSIIYHEPISCIDNRQGIWTEAPKAAMWVTISWSNWLWQVAACRRSVCKPCANLDSPKDSERMTLSFFYHQCRSCQGNSKRHAGNPIRTLFTNDKLYAQASKKIKATENR